MAFVAHRDFRSDVALRPQPKRMGPDSWPTPACLITALINDVLPALPVGPVWDPACGTGGIVTALRNAGRQVLANDLWSDNPAARRDFLIDDPPRTDLAAIVRNPPFVLLDEFITRGLEHLEAGITQSLVLLLRNDHLTAKSRAAMLGRASEIRMCVWRPRWIADSTTSPRWSFCWVTWHWDYLGPPAFLTTSRRSATDRMPLEGADNV
jgi:hypothetical protein